MKQLIRIKKIILRSILYLIDPERCVPRVIHYEDKEWYLAESTKPSISGRMAIYVSYLRFEKDETIYLMEVSDFNRGSAYRELHRALWKLRIF
jgi:hypothetical protein